MPDERPPTAHFLDPPLAHRIPRARPLALDGERHHGRDRFGDSLARLRSLRSQKLSLPLPRRLLPASHSQDGIVGRHGRILSRADAPTKMESRAVC